MADEETNKLVDEVEEKEVKEEVAPTEEKAPEVQAEPEPVTDEIANPPVEDVTEASTIDEVMALVKQLQAQVDALSTIQPEPEPLPQTESEQSTPASERTLEEPKQDDPEDIEKLLDL